MRHATTMRFILFIPFAANFACSSYADELTPRQKQGYALAERMCAGCHAVGRADQSPHIGAPPFRSLDRRVDIDSFVARLRDGLTSGHPDMPTFRFTRQDARAFIAYLRSVQAP
jgi:mono/diheme cytochrome c family protein